MMRDTGKLLLTYGHDGPWDLDDPNDENRFTMEAWGAQMELRAIQRRNRDQRHDPGPGRPGTGSGRSRESERARGSGCEGSGYGRDRGAVPEPRDHGLPRSERFTPFRLCASAMACLFDFR
ncbi:hypothetical protein ABZ350_35405, partial [Streptomyces uncialis]